ncbi:MAG: hypothetical protein KUG71_06410 [Porticoccaceae bacterium]|nr:hypothetical protein [Porticoccaceae bacterium]
MIGAICLTVFVGPQIYAGDTNFGEPVIGTKGYHLGDYGGGAYWVSDGRTNSMFVVTDEGVNEKGAGSYILHLIPDVNALYLENTASINLEGSNLQ